METKLEQRKSLWRQGRTANLADDEEYDDFAYHANDWDAEPWEKVDNDPAYMSEEDAYLGEEDGQQEVEETEDAVEAEELNCMAHLAETFGDQVWDEAEKASDYVQSCA